MRKVAKAARMEERMLIPLSVEDKVGADTGKFGW